ncbi:MAG: bifunctional UDP-N-acetylglucosamine diphosphorylase/glucosamine-1-phosphate N-acetyltransferase GlmU [Micrococcales bacterium]|nr:bifunctional UDP-N-acetylglucosamine diphosphorylase/glucosamine-1-phosphate N-acetyltransferase GlmU [Micrococcales bacterium]
MPKPAVIILAAGEGTRMKSATPKVLHQAAGRSLLGYAMAAAQALDPERLVVVVRHGRDQVAPAAQAIHPDVLIAEQDEVPGTGRAVQCALAAMDQAGVAAKGGVVVIPCDTPLLDAETLTSLLEAHQQESNAVTILTAEVEDPFGYGRIIRGQDGQVTAIVEERDATPDQRNIKEINSSTYVFDLDLLQEALGQVNQENAQGEVYLTDVIALARWAAKPVKAVICQDPDQVQGVNDRVQLAEAAQRLTERRLRQAMVNGVTIIDPSTTFLGPEVELASDVVIEPGTALRGRTKVERGAGIGPFTTLTDCEVGEGATVDRTVATGVIIGAGATVGPFTHLRPGTVLGQSTKAGSFTELKAAVIDDGAKVPHLSYVGDAHVGPGANVGAGTIFANYDGVTKSRSEVGPAARIGSNNVLVAPVNFGAGAYSGAGTVIRHDVPPGALAVGCGEHRLVEGWTAKKRPGSDSAEAAAQTKNTDKA